MTIAQLIAQAKAEGRHSDVTTYVCGGCGRDVLAIHHVTLSRVRLCRKCSVRGGCTCPDCKAAGAKLLEALATPTPEAK